MNITIFGGSSPKPGSKAYQQAYKLGQTLAQAGHSVLTGGYIGTMEAVSRGAAEVGGHVIGVTCSEIENWRPVKAAMALPGGPGTLTEIALTWNLIIIQAIPEKPLILIGEEWHLVMDTMFEALDEYIPLSQRKLLRFAKDIEAACSMLLN
jgi:hypothetical protein